MTMLVVDFPQMQSAMSHMASFGRDVAECLEDVDRTMATLRATWHGDGSDAQAQAQQQWETGAERMKAALSTLQTIAAAAQRNYSDAVAKNGQMWG